MRDHYNRPVTKDQNKPGAKYRDRPVNNQENMPVTKHHKMPMAKHRRKYLWLAVAVLLVIQATLALTMVHRESLTFDEDDHMFAGYMMWKAGDYGLNPEHPPLVKLLATVPLLGTICGFHRLGITRFSKLKRI